MIVFELQIIKKHLNNINIPFKENENKNQMMVENNKDEYDLLCTDKFQIMIVGLPSCVKTK